MFIGTGVQLVISEMNRIPISFSCWDFTSVILSVFSEFLGITNNKNEFLKIMDRDPVVALAGFQSWKMLLWDWNPRNTRPLCYYVSGRSCTDSLVLCLSKNPVREDRKQECCLRSVYKRLISSLQDARATAPISSIISFLLSLFHILETDERDRPWNASNKEKRPIAFQTIRTGIQNEVPKRFLFLCWTGNRMSGLKVRPDR